MAWGCMVELQWMMAIAGLQSGCAPPGRDPFEGTQGWNQLRHPECWQGTDLQVQLEAAPSLLFGLPEELSKAVSMSARKLAPPFLALSAARGLPLAGKPSRLSSEGVWGGWSAIVQRGGSGGSTEHPRVRLVVVGSCSAAMEFCYGQLRHPIFPPTKPYRWP